MAEPDPLTDLLGLVAAPIAGTLRSIEQFRRGVDEFLNGVENFNRTMDNLNQTAARVNVLLEEVEEPLKAAIPQVTRTVKTADQMMQVVSGPAMAAAPALERMAGVMSSPEVEQIPRQIQQFTEVLGELSNRLAPLTHLAGSAGGLFGGLRIPGFTAPGDSDAKSAPPGVRIETTEPADEAPPADDAVDEPTIEPVAADDLVEESAEPHPQHDPVADVVTEPPLDDTPRRTPPPTRITRTSVPTPESTSTATKKPAAEKSTAKTKKKSSTGSDAKKSAAKKSSSSKDAKKSSSKK